MSENLTPGQISTVASKVADLVDKIERKQQEINDLEQSVIRFKEAKERMAELNKELDGHLKNMLEQSDDVRFDFLKGLVKFSIVMGMRRGRGS